MRWRSLDRVVIWSFCQIWHYQVTSRAIVSVSEHNCGQRQVSHLSAPSARVLFLAHLDLHFRENERDIRENERKFTRLYGR